MSQEHLPLDQNECYGELRSRLARYIKEEVVDDLMRRQLPEFDNRSLIEMLEADPELAHRAVDEMFNFENANPQ